MSRKYVSYNHTRLIFQHSFAKLVDIEVHVIGRSCPKQFLGISTAEILIGTSLGWAILAYH